MQKPAFKLLHADHGMTDELVRELVSRVSPAEFFAKTLELPEGVPDAMSAIHGPIAGDPPVPDAEVVMKQRSSDRPMSRMVARAPRPTRKVTIIGSFEPDGSVTVYTCFGGPLAPREPGDESMAGDEAAIAESKAFWAQHALSLG